MLVGAVKLLHFAETSFALPPLAVRVVCALLFWLPQAFGYHDASYGLGVVVDVVELAELLRGKGRLEVRVPLVEQRGNPGALVLRQGAVAFPAARFMDESCGAQCLDAALEPPDLAGGELEQLGGFGTIHLFAQKPFHYIVAIYFFFAHGE